MTRSIAAKLAGSLLVIDELGRRQKIDELFDELERVREAHRERNPGLAFPGVASLTAHAAASGLVLQSVVGTVFYAGYPNISIRVGGKFLRFRASERDLTGCANRQEFTYVPCPPPLGDRVLHVQPGSKGWRIRAVDGVKDLALATPSRAHRLASLTYPCRLVPEPVRRLG